MTKLNGFRLPAGIVPVIDNPAERPSWVIAGVCTGCGFEGDGAEFEWSNLGEVPKRLKCPRCASPAWEIPYQLLGLRTDVVLQLPNHYDQYQCENCSTSSRFGPMAINGTRRWWCGTCSLAVSHYHQRTSPEVIGHQADGEPIFKHQAERPEFSKFLAVLTEARDKVAKRRVVIPGADISGPAN